MLRHIVLFAFDGFDSTAAKRAHLEQTRQALQELVPQIAPLRSLVVYLNENPNESYDLMLEAEVDTLEDLATYSAHPLHQAVVQQLIKPYLRSRACVDYTLPSA